MTKKEKDNYGYSPLATPKKQEDFKKIIKKHIEIIKSILNKHQWADQNYWYFDLNAGPGIHYDNKSGLKIGSPIIFLKEAMTKKLKSNVILFENGKEGKENCSSLLESISTLKIPSSFIKYTIHNESNDRFLRNYYRQIKAISFGLVYHDPKGFPDFDLLSSIFRFGEHQRLDLMINCPCNTIKKTVYCSKCHETRKLNELISIIKKDYWLIREPCGPHQWSLIIGSNWNHFPKFKELGFLEKDSYEGQKLFEKLTFRAEDIKNGKI